jgi:phosphoribosylformylglycinamidine synthase I
MEKRLDALLLKFPGTNCDGETDRALQVAGFDTETQPISLASRERLMRCDLLVLSGGFSYGDYVMAAKIAQLEIQRRLGDALQAYHKSGGHILGICNGFQILMRMGLLPEGSLIANTTGRFQCRWVDVRRTVSDSPYLQGLPERFPLPIAHAEGRFVAPPGKSAEYKARGLVALEYLDEVNGSEERIAGLQDETRRVFGLMPHPERFILARHHPNPDWSQPAWGLQFFRSILSKLKSPAGSAAA